MSQLAFPFADAGPGGCPFTHKARRCQRAPGHLGVHWDGKWHYINQDDPRRRK